MRRLLLITALIVVTIPVYASQSLREAVKKYGAKETLVLREFSPVELPELIRQADLIVQVLITQANGFLTRDEESIDTDYTVHVLDVLKAAAGVGVNPGQVLTIRRPGGSVLIEGQVVKAIENDFPAFNAGEEYVLFLSRSKERGIFRVGYGAQGAFSVVSGEVKQVSRFFGTWNKKHGKVRTEVFHQRVAADLARQ